MILNYLRLLLIQVLSLNIVIYLLLKVLHKDLQQYLFIFLIANLIVLPLPALFLFKEPSKQNRQKKYDYFFLNFYSFLLVLFMLLFSIFLEFSNKKAVTDNEDGLYLVNPKKLLAISNGNAPLEEKISKLSELSEFYPADIDVYKALMNAKRQKYFESHKVLSLKIASLDEKLKTYKKEAKTQDFNLAYQSLLNVLPSEQEFEPLKEKYSVLVDAKKKKLNHQVKNHPNPIAKLEQLVNEQSFIEAGNLGISLFHKYCENADFEELYKKNLLEFNTREFYMRGFIQRAEKEGIEKKNSSPILLETQDEKTLKLQDFLFFKDIVIAKNVLLKDKATSSLIKYDYGILEGNIVFLKSHIDKPSLILSSSEAESFFKNYPLIFSPSPMNFLKYDLVSLLKAMNLIKKFNPNNYPYLHFLFSFYINLFFTNIITLLALIYFSYNTTKNNFNPIFFLFGVFFSTLFHLSKIYFSFTLFYFSMGDYLYFYLFDSLINLLMLFLAISLYSNTNPKISSENAYAFYENTLKR